MRVCHVFLIRPVFFNLLNLISFFCCEPFFRTRNAGSMKQVNPVESVVSLFLKALFDKVLVEISTAVAPGDFMEVFFMRCIHLSHEGFNEKHRKI